MLFEIFNNVEEVNDFINSAMVLVKYDSDAMSAKQRTHNDILKKYAREVLTDPENQQDIVSWKLTTPGSSKIYSLICDKLGVKGN
jgi:hypothetical protein